MAIDLPPTGRSPRCVECHPPNPTRPPPAAHAAPRLCALAGLHLTRTLRPAPDGSPRVDRRSFLPLVDGDGLNSWHRSCGPPRPPAPQASRCALASWSARRLEGGPQADRHPRPPVLPSTDVSPLCKGCHPPNPARPPPRRRATRSPAMVRRPGRCPKPAEATGHGPKLLHGSARQAGHADLEHRRKADDRRWRSPSHRRERPWPCSATVAVGPPDADAAPETMRSCRLRLTTTNCRQTAAVDLGSHCGVAGRTLLERSPTGTMNSGQALGPTAPPSR